MLGRVLKWIIYISLFVGTISAVFAVPPEVLNPPMGAVIPSYQPYFEMTPDPMAQAYECQVSADPGFGVILQTFNQVNIMLNPNTIQQVTLDPSIPTQTPLFMQCRVDQGSGYGPYGPAYEFTLGEPFQYECKPSQEGIFTAPAQAYFSIFEDPDGCTPVDRTIFEKKTCLSYAVAYDMNLMDVPTLNVSVRYNDTVFNVTDTYLLDWPNNQTPTTQATHAVNTYYWISPIDSVNTDDNKYNVNIKVENLSALSGGRWPASDECEFNYTYAMNLNPNLSSDTGNVKLGMVLGMTLFLFALAGFMYISMKLGARRRNDADD